MLGQHKSDETANQRKAGLDREEEDQRNALFNLFLVGISVSTFHHLSRPDCGIEREKVQAFFSEEYLTRLKNGIGEVVQSLGENP